MMSEQQELYIILTSIGTRALGRAGGTIGGASWKRTGASALRLRLPERDFPAHRMPPQNTNPARKSPLARLRQRLLVAGLTFTLWSALQNLIWLLSSLIYA